MKITEKQREVGVAIARKRELSAIYVNEKGEYFTDENSAKNSVAGAADGYARISVQAEVTEKEKPLPADELVAKIEAATTVEAVEEILAAERAGKNRKTVVEAAETQVSLLKGA